jgi:hypothetical protein
MNRYLLPTLLMGVFASTGFAADNAAEAGRRCVGIQDSLQRLMCFDKAFAIDRAESAAPRSAPPLRTEITAPVVAPTPAPSLGDETIRKQPKERDREQPQELTAVVTALKEFRKNTYRITLDNGQVWEQMDLGDGLRIAVGDTVSIERRRMGGHYLVLGARKTGQVRVSRLK